MKHVFFLITITLSLHISKFSSSPIPQKYNAIFNFGDSVSDTGNALIAETSTLPIRKLPYGETFFGHPTGRCCDGRLIIDFLAEAFGLPYLPPYLALKQGREEYVGAGINFAVAGAYVLNSSFSLTNCSLSVQVDLFKKTKSMLCSSPEDCRRFMKKSLFVVEVIGGNDYNHEFFAGKSIEQIETLIPPVVDHIANATITLINEGATELMVPGNFPIGCMVVYLYTLSSPNKSDYDSIGCLKALNAFSMLHNSHLQRSLEKLRQKYPHAKIMYVDYYGATMQFFLNPERYGFNKETLLKPCCGGIGVNSLIACGTPGSTTCKDPSKYASWDGIHFTEAANWFISQSLLHGPFTDPPLISHSFSPSNVS